jgi:hypothetical protein
MNRSSLFRTFAFLLTICCLSCNKSNHAPTNPSFDTAADILTYQIQGLPAQISMSYPNIMVQFSDSVTNPGDLVASFTLSPGCQATVNGAPQTSGVTRNNFQYAMTYDVTDPAGGSTQWEVIGTNNNYSVGWGLGQFILQEVSNDRAYEWYIDQGTTGEYSDVNCGPSSVTMAIHWYDSTFTQSPEDARSEFGPQGSLWYPIYINEYLEQYNVPYVPLTLGDSATQTRDILKAQRDSGRIGILILFTGPIRDATFAGRADRYYGNDFGHFLVVKGYKALDDDFFFEVYDPWDFGVTYEGGQPMGENRYYRYSDIYEACVNWGNQGWVILPK